MTLNTKRADTYTCVTSVPQSQISVSFTLHPAIFEFDDTEYTGNFRQMHQMTQNDTRRLKVPHICVTRSTSPKFQSVRSTTGYFRVTGHFESNALSDPKVKGTSYISVTYIPESQSSLGFAVQPAIIELKRCRKSVIHRMTSE